MTSRESIGSTGSASRLIPDSTPQPPPKYSQSDAKVLYKDTTSKITISAVVLVCRVVACIASFAIGISLAALEVWSPEQIALTVFTWLAATWNGVLLIGFLHKPSARMSLVLGNGRVITFGSPGNGEGGDRRSYHRFPRAFWVDLLLVSATLASNIASTVIGRRHARATINLDWIPIGFHIAVALLTMYPALAAAHIRFEPTEMPQISLP
ncbi:hypothetical protein F5B17DRAFT_136931 [Nemania serpens]|nr:hypothetical protein F5B17DRAFT_136931 [Nemania serpens]